MGKCGDGAALCAPKRRASGPICGSLMYFAGGGGAGSGHKLVTGLKEKGPAMSQALENVARPAGFEPTTPWFVGRWPAVLPNAPKLHSPLQALIYGLS